MTETVVGRPTPTNWLTTWRSNSATWRLKMCIRAIMSAGTLTRESSAFWSLTGFDNVVPVELSWWLAMSGQIGQLLLLSDSCCPAGDLRSQCTDERECFLIPTPSRFQWFSPIPIRAPRFSHVLFPFFSQSNRLLLLLPAATPILVYHSTCCCKFPWDLRDPWKFPI